MPSYHYEAMYSTGERSTGVVEASSKNEAVAKIRQTHEIVVSLTEVKTAVAEDPLQRFQKLDLKALSLMCQQFSIILKAGLPLVQTVDLVAHQTSDKTLKKLLTQVSEDITNGWSMSYSFTQRGASKLPSTFIETVRAGEESGDLVKSFDRMSSYYERMSKTRAKATSAMMYPAFVLVVAAFVIMVIMAYAIPSFSSTFKSMGMELPTITKVVIAVSDFTSNYIWVMVGGFAFLLLAVKLYGTTDRGKYHLARFKLAIPILGKIAVMAGASQFAHTMSTMLSSGMPILQALNISSRAVTNLCISEQIASVIPGVEEGHSLGSCMEKCPDLPDMLVQMTAMGEATGSMESILGILAEYYDAEVDTLTARALALLEPMIICILAVVVVGILLSIYLPMFSMYGSI